MPHEMTHLVFHQLTAHANVIPTWFDEGLAVYNQMYHEPEMTARLQKALDTQTLLSLDDISGGFPPDADKAYLAYAQRCNLVAYMHSTFGQARMTANTGKTDFTATYSVKLREATAMLLRYTWHGRIYTRSILLAALLCLCTLLLSPVAFAHTALAASDPITVISQTDIIHFPNYIDFDMSAKDTRSIITQATITITFTVPGYVDQQYDQTVPINHPASTVALQWRQKTTGNNFYPPGTLVSYNWKLQDSIGTVSDDGVQSFKTIH